MRLRWTHITAIVVGVVAWVAVWFFASAIIYWLMGGT